MALDISVIQSLTYEREQDSVKELVASSTASCYALAKYVMYNASFPALIVSYSTDSGSHYATLELDASLNKGNFIDITGLGPRILPLTLDDEIKDHFEGGSFGFLSISKHIYRPSRLNKQDFVHIEKARVDDFQPAIVSFPEDPIGFMHRLADTYTSEQLNSDPRSCVMELVVDIAEEEVHKLEASSEYMPV